MKIKIQWHMVECRVPFLYDDIKEFLNIHRSHFEMDQNHLRNHSMLPIT